MITELTNLLAQTPKRAAYIAVSRRLLVRLHKQMQAMATALPQVANDDTFSVLADRKLSRIEFLLFRILFQHQGQPVAADVLLATAAVKTKQALWVHIRRLRMKLAGTHFAVETWQGNGYCLVINPKEVTYESESY